MALQVWSPEVQVKSVPSSVKVVSVRIVPVAVDPVNRPVIVILRDPVELLIVIGSVTLIEKLPSAAIGWGPGELRFPPEMCAGGVQDSFTCPVWRLTTDFPSAETSKLKISLKLDLPW